jgi:hypothetical protein
MQADRRRDPHPWTWEGPAAATVALLLLLVVAIQVGRSLANALAGAGWTWPMADEGAASASPIGTAFWTSVPGIVAGDASAGLAGSSAAPVADRWVLAVCVAACETAVLVMAAAVIVHAWRTWGPHRLRGMASRAEAEALLGVSRLRTVAPLVRPDLHGRGHRTDRATDPYESDRLMPTTRVVEEQIGRWARRPGQGRGAAR